MYKNSVKYLQGINFSQLTLTQRTDIKNLSCATLDLGISESSSSKIQTYVRKFNPAIYIKHMWSCGCAERKVTQGLLTNNIIILASGLL
jgi:hypothetical protein